MKNVIMKNVLMKTKCNKKKKRKKKKIPQQTNIWKTISTSRFLNLWLLSISRPDCAGKDLPVNWWSMTSVFFFFFFFFFFFKLRSGVMFSNNQLVNST